MNEIPDSEVPESVHAVYPTKQAWFDHILDLVLFSKETPDPFQGADAIELPRIYRADNSITLEDEAWRMIRDAAVTVYDATNKLRMVAEIASRFFASTVNCKDEYRRSVNRIESAIAWLMENPDADLGLLESLPEHKTKAEREHEARVKGGKRKSIQCYGVLALVKQEIVRTRKDHKREATAREIIDSIPSSYDARDVDTDRGTFTIYVDGQRIFQEDVNGKKGSIARASFARYVTKARKELSEIRK